MFKKGILYFNLMVMTNLALAQSAMPSSFKGEMPPPPPSRNAPSLIMEKRSHYTFGSGPYMGVSLGTRTNYTSNPATYKGLEATFFGGMSGLWNNFYLAEELFVGNSAKLLDYTFDPGPNENQISAKSSWSAGLAIMPGLLITDNVLAYLRVGVLKTNFTDVATNASSGISNGGQLGLGFQIAIAMNWDLRADYIYSFYEQPRETGLGSPKTDQFNLGLIYKFL